jgi:hypothetical protein
MEEGQMQQKMERVGYGQGIRLPLKAEKGKKTSPQASKKEALILPQQGLCGTSYPQNGKILTVPTVIWQSSKGK